MWYRGVLTMSITVLVKEVLVLMLERQGKDGILDRTPDNPTYILTEIP